ncbi:divalent-cation tolerance protein CutA [Candidatus Gottesmanbacteria bacterium]|nr:divalent-cation tolerance protein CutA [Candidatus Gottesmanbacteria bacterium]
MNIVYVPCKNEEESKEIANIIIKEKLAFCTNIIPGCYSIYRWQGKVEKSEESLLIIKTLPHLVKKLISRIKNLHSYKMPEIISWKIDEVSPGIVNWAVNELNIKI